MKFDEKVKLIKALPFFKVLPAQELRAIAFAAKFQNLPKKTTFIEQGESSEAIFIIIKGSVRIYRITDEGEEINLSVAGPGEVIGEMALVDSEPRSAFVETLENSEVLTLSCPDFIKILRIYPEIAMRLLSSLSHKIRSADERMEDIMTKKLIDRTYNMLSILAKYFEGREINMSHEELATIIGATRARVTETLDELERLGKLELTHRKIILK